MKYYIYFIMTNQEIDYFKSLNLSINETKDLIQNEAIKKTITTVINKDSKGGVIEAFTGFGKSYIIKKICSRYLERNPDKKVTIIVPSEYLERMIKSDLEDLNSKNIEIFILNTYTMILDEIHYTGLVIFDEVHHILNNDSKFFSTAIEKTKFDFFIGLSAFLEAKHKSFLEKHNIFVTYNIELIDGINLGIIPKFKIYNLGIDFTSKEKEKYIEWEQISKSNRRPFEEFQNISRINAYDLALFITDFDPDKRFKIKSSVINRLLNEPDDIANEFYNIPKNDMLNLICKFVECTPFDLKKKAFMYSKAIREKNNIIKNSIRKLEIAKEFITNNTKKSIVFTPNSINICDSIAKLGKNSNTIAYHSKINKGRRKKIIDAFNANLFQNIVVVQTLDEGFSVNDVTRGLILDVAGVTLRNIQRLGRLLRIDMNDLDKIAEMIYVYHKSFVYYDEDLEDDIEIYPSDLQRLKSAQKEFISIEYINSLEEIL